MLILHPVPPRRIGFAVGLLLIGRVSLAFFCYVRDDGSLERDGLPDKEIINNLHSEMMEASREMAFLDFIFDPLDPRFPPEAKPLLNMRVIARVRLGIGVPPEPEPLLTIIQS